MGERRKIFNSTNYTTARPILKLLKPKKKISTLTDKKQRKKEGAISYSQYSPKYQIPKIDKEELENLKKKKSKEELQGLYIKAALSSQNCSVFYDKDVQKFTNYLMRKGKKELARDLVESAFTLIKHLQLRKYNQETDPEVKNQILVRPIEVFHLAIKNVTPVMSVKKIKKSGTWYQVPTGISGSRAKFLAMNWIIKMAKDKDKTLHFSKSLASEILAASNYEGKALNKKLELHKLCEANKGYASYKWT